MEILTWQRVFRRMLVPSIVIGIAWTIMTSICIGLSTAFTRGFNPLHARAAEWLDLAAALSFALVITAPLVFIPVMGASVAANLTASAMAVRNNEYLTGARRWQFAATYAAVLGVVVAFCVIGFVPNLSSLASVAVLVLVALAVVYLSVGRSLRSSSN